jgi:hypothetical protein
MSAQQLYRIYYLPRQVDTGCVRLQNVSSVQGSVGFL